MAENVLAKTLPRYLNSLPNQVLNMNDLSLIIHDYAKAINQPLGVEPEEYVKYLVDNNQLNRLEIVGPKNNIVRFALSLPTAYELGLSLKKDSFFSHLTAARLLGVSDANSPLMYVSSEVKVAEQQKIDVDVDLEQEAIDESFRRVQRKSNAEYHWMKYRYLLLTGRNIHKKDIAEKDGLSMTCLERTLIDLMARPQYGGGAVQVLNIFKSALGKTDTKQLIKTMDRIPFIYPYHQSLGWYLENAGYSGTYLNSLRKRRKPHKFYLDYGMIYPGYSDEWKLFYPKEIEAAIK